VRGLAVGVRDFVVEPAELQLAPRVEAVRHAADGAIAGPEPRTGRHHGPEGGAVLAAGGARQAGQAEVVPESVGEDTETAVLGLDGVVADPEPGVTDLDAPAQVTLRARVADEVDERVPPVRPDGVRAERAAAGFLSLAGKDQLEVVEISVG